MKRQRPTFLVVVDMQPYFCSSQNRTLIRNICHQIRLAKRRQANIIIVEYEVEEYSTIGRTDHRITAAIGNYLKAYFVKKSSDNGGYAICKFLKWAYGNANEFEEGSFRVVGVNSTACVLETVKGLSKRLPQASIQVIRKCCRDEWKTPPSVEFQEMMPKNAVVV